MMISKEKYNLINNWFIIIILSTIFFRPVSTILIMIYVAFNLLFFKQLSFKIKNIGYLIVLMIPFLLELFFLWNNGISQLFTPIEKVLSFLIFPVLIIFNYKQYNFINIANWYRKIVTSLMAILLIRFLIVAPEFVEKYINGIHLWEMGYVFTNSFGNHAPAVNMQIAFVVLLNLYFLLTENNKQKLVNYLVLLLSVITLFVINTRLSLGSCILCCLILFIYFTYKKYKAKSLYFIGGFALILSLIVSIAFISNPYMKEKYSKVTFANMDKIGKLDEVENPDGVLHNALVTRVTIWKTTLELADKKIFFGYGSSHAKDKLFDYYKETNQKFLSKYQFPVHNQFFDYLLRFGIFGIIALIVFFISVFRFSILSNNIIGFCFILNFVLSNLFDDFLIRFDGIVFCAIWFSLIMANYLSKLRIDKL